MFNLIPTSAQRFSLVLLIAGVLLLVAWQATPTMACGATAESKQVRIIEAAWTKALAVAGVPLGSDIPHPSYRIVPEARYFPSPWNSINRLCGETEPYLVRGVTPAEFIIAFEVSVYIPPGDPKADELLFAVLVHENLHVIGLTLNLPSEDDPGSERWIRTIWPAECPSY